MQPALIVNANAGATRRNPRLPAQLRAAAGGRAELFVTHDADELSRTAAALAARNTRLVGVVGGDGTASTTLTALWRAYGEQALPDIAFLRGGTMNTVAQLARYKSAPARSSSCAAPCAAGKGRVSRATWRDRPCRSATGSVSCSGRA